jgi:hypothetical protein
MENNVGYDKIKHLVEVEDHILAVFTINMEGNMGNLSMAKNIDVDNNIIEKIFSFLKNIQNNVHDDNIITSIVELGKLKWKIFEYERIRILQIFDGETIVVLIKVDTSLDQTIDNILGYYFEDEIIPKSLF